MSLTADIISMRSASEPAQDGRTKTVPVTGHTVGAMDWDRAIADFDGVVQEQLYVFAHQHWPDVAIEPWLFSAHGEVVGGALVMVKPLPLRLGAIAICKWGPILRSTSRTDALAVYGGIVDALTDEFAQRRGMMLSILPRASLYRENAESAQLLARGFKTGAELSFPNRYLVNLRLDDEAQRKSLHQKWRYHLNKAEKSGLTFEHAGAERFDEFQALYNAMTDRKQFADYSAYTTLAGLMALDIEGLRPELFFVRKDDEVVAGAVIFTAGDVAVYLYGATNDQALPLRAGYFMQWQVIRWLRDNRKANWYDLGGTDGHQGLHQFKKGLIGEAGVISPLPRVANHAVKLLPALAGQGAFVAREAYHRIRNTIIGVVKPGNRASQSDNETQYLGD